MKHPLLPLLLLLLLQVPTKAQQVGLVFSGGGAKGLAHIGVLKALEENNIPIDYVVGTSMGGIVGGMYAAGYTPQEIEKIALSADFQKWVNGTYDSDYTHYFAKKPLNPSFLTAKLQVDTGFNFKLRSNLINDVPLNFALLELFGQASVNSKGNFDSLFVPFRCIVSDVLSQKMIAVKQGNLPEAIRGTFTVPLVYRPIKVDDKYVFDGGLYNNFPIDVLKAEFKPDYIIGTNVSSKIFNEYPSDNDEKLMNRFLIYLFLSKSDSTSIGENGTYIQPDVSEFSTTNFNPVAELIKRGYDATMADMPKIKAEVSRRTDRWQLNSARAEFINSRAELQFGNVKALGLNSKQTKYVESILKGPLIGSQSLDEVKEGYYHLVADDNFETVYPRINHQSDSGSYDFELLVEAKKNFKVDFGGVISTRPISNAYIGLQYNYLRKKSYTLSANFYAGGFYESAQGTIRIDVPAQIPFYLESEFTYNHWDYFNKGQIFVENVNPTFAEQSDRKIALKIGARIGSGKLEAQAGYINFDDRYSPTQTFQIGDIMDFNSFNGGYNTLIYSHNNLNRRQYANTGSQTELSFSYYRGVENYTPGNIYRGQLAYNLIMPERNQLDWVLARFMREKYFINNKIYSLGYISEVVLSNRPSFSTYKASILSAPAFNPLQDSKSLFLENFRANTYGAVGLKNVFNIRKNFDARIEAYLFQPMEKIFQFGLQSVSYGDLFADRHYAASAGLVFHTLGGPISLSINHYDDSQKRFGMMFHMGFLIYNKRSFE